MKAKITRTLIKTLKPKTKPFEVRDTEVNGFLLRVQETGVMTYYYSYRSKEGTKKRFRIGRVGNISPTQARDTVEQISATVIQGTDVAVEKKQLKQDAENKRLNTLKLFIDERYKPWVLSHRKSGQSTLNILKYNFSIFDNLPLEEITVLKVEEFRRVKIKAEISNSTINRNVGTLRAVLAKAVEWDILQTHPLEKLKPLKVDTTPRVRYLRPDEESRLFQVLKDRDIEQKKARTRTNKWNDERGYEHLPDLSKLHFADRMLPMITLSLKTGLRQGELFSLCWMDVTLEGDIPTITVRAEESKSSKVRYIPISPLALDVLKEWYKQRDLKNPLVFPSDNGSRLDNVQKSWTSILKKAAITGFRWHDMRHDFASQLVMKGAHLNTVRELCGHANMTTTLRYAHLAPDHKADAIALLG